MELSGRFSCSDFILSDSSKGNRSSKRREILRFRHTQHTVNEQRIIKSSLFNLIFSKLALNVLSLNCFGLLTFYNI